MEFPLFVASDVHGEKVNLALRYAPRTTLECLLSVASRCFDDIVCLMRLGPLPPFSAAYIYRDVLCRWDVLEDCVQLSPFCQVYVFRQLVNEVVAVIPDPLELSQVLSVHRKKNERVTLLGDTSPLPEAPLLTSSTSTSLARFPTSRKGLSKSGQHHETSRNRCSVALPLGKCRFALVHAAGPTRSDKATGTAEEADGFQPVCFADRAATFRSLKSHRFRLQIFSPPVETQMYCQGTTRSAATTPFRVASFTASEPQAAYRKPKRHHLSDSYDATPAPSSTGEVALPRSWRNSSTQSPASASPWTGGSGQLSSERFSVSSHSGGTGPHFSLRGSRSRALLPTDEHHCQVFTKRQPRSGRGKSILQEERERVAAQMLLGIDELRSRLQEETQQLTWSLSNSGLSRVLPLNSAYDGRI
ncbi:hypothetical protein, conserved [Leishmania tarentolae]|uniref:BILBO1 N-terminal domain-containing protein n=1 Tax=Leishmania tarentolae TaxID=5689 RepID=A0A640KN76_LEITA|nr:hypothetical protein, conserved [Leishmania tarentolae]